MAERNMDSSVDQLAVNTIRFLAVDAVEKAQSGHPGAPSGMADYAFVLWTRYLKFNPYVPSWQNRDRFVLSAGHASMLLYALLHLSGYKMPMEQIKKFRQWDSITPGHIEYDRAPGVEATTGPLGQGFGNAIGMAIASKMLAARFNRPGFPIIDHKVFSIVSDGDLMEGISNEAASIAGHLGLGNIIYIYDDNHISIEGDTELTYSDDVEERFEGYGWHVQRIDGHDRDAADKAIGAAIAEDRRPSLIIARTHIGYGAPHKQDTREAHGEPLGADEVEAMKKNLGWPLEPTFYVPDEVYELFRIRRKTLEEEFHGWSVMFVRYREKYPKEARLWSDMMARKVPDNVTQLLLGSVENKEDATRNHSGIIMQEIAKQIPSFIGGSADLAPSTKTLLKGFDDISKDHFEGRNLHFGIREHAMGAICSGMALYGGFIPYAATFLIFSDYMRPSLRLASMQHLQVIYIYTHDSVFLGEDGPTHEPIEHLASIRAIPGFDIIRPADAAETAVAWAVALKNHNSPTALALTRQKVPPIERQNPNSVLDLAKGAYIIYTSPINSIDLILMASGSELQLATAAAKMLSEKGIGARVVSFPCQTLFDRQSRDYIESVLLPDVANRVAIEAAASLSWYRYVGPYGLIIGIDKFGASAPYKVIAEKLGFTPDLVTARILDYLELRKQDPKRPTILGTPQIFCK